jgi:hypothetical protein
MHRRQHFSKEEAQFVILIMLQMDKNPPTAFIFSLKQYVMMPAV